MILPPRPVAASRPGVDTRAFCSLMVGSRFTMPALAWGRPCPATLKPRMNPEEITIQLVEIRASLADFKESAKEDFVAIKTQTTATNGRLRRVELVQARLQGAVALGVFVLPIAAAYLATRI